MIDSLLDGIFLLLIVILSEVQVKKTHTRKMACRFELNMYMFFYQISCIFCCFLILTGRNLQERDVILDFVLASVFLVRALQQLNIATH